MPASQSKKKPKKRRLFDVTVDEVSLVDNPAVPEATFCIAKRLSKEDLMALKEELAKEQSEPTTDETIEQVAKDAAAPDDDSDKSDGEKLEKADAAVAKAFATAIQALRKVAPQMDAEALEKLASILHYVRWRFQEVDAIKSELAKCDEIDGLKKSEKPAKQSDRPDWADELLKSLQDIVTGAFGGGAVVTPVEKPADAKDQAGDTATEQTEPQDDAEKADSASTDGEPATAETGDESSETQEKAAKPTVLEEAAKLLEKRLADRQANKQRELEKQAFERISSLAAKLESSLERVDDIGKKLNRATGKVD